MKNKIIIGLVLLAVLICTCVIHHLLFDEHTKLFYINVIATCIAEIILLTNIPILSNEKWLTFKNAATTTILNAYAVFLFLWTSIYSLCIEGEEDYKTLYIGMLVLSVVFVVLLSSVELGGNFMKKQEDDFRQVTQNKKVFLVSLNMYWVEIQEILQTFQSDWKENTLQELRVVIDKLSMIPSKKMEDNTDITIKINSRLDNIRNLFKEVAEDTENIELQKKSTQEIEQLRNYITEIRSSL